MGEHILKRRLLLDMTQARIAELFDASPFTVGNWENGHAEPKIFQIPILIKFLGYNPVNHNPNSIAEHLLFKRRALDKDGQVVLALNTPYRDGTTHIVLSPLESMQRLAALVSRPRLNLIRFHGVLAPNAKLRCEIIPGSKKNKSNPSGTNAAVPHSSASVRISWARLLKRMFEISTLSTARIVAGI